MGGDEEKMTFSTKIKHIILFDEKAFSFFRCGFSLYIEDDRELNKKGITSSFSSKNLIEKSPLALENN